MSFKCVTLPSPKNSSCSLSSSDEDTFNAIYKQNKPKLDRYSSKGVKIKRWTCSCVCGNEKTVRQSDLVSGMTRSCGCLKIEKTIERNRKSAPA